MILSEVPEAQVDGNVGRTSSFEVTINGKSVYSKLGQGAFPKFESVSYKKCNKVKHSTLSIFKGGGRMHQSSQRSRRGDRDREAGGLLRHSVERESLLSQQAISNIGIIFK